MSRMFFARLIIGGAVIAFFAWLGSVSIFWMFALFFVVLAIILVLCLARLSAGDEVQLDHPVPPNATSLTSREESFVPGEVDMLYGDNTTRMVRLRDEQAAAQLRELLSRKPAS